MGWNDEDRKDITRAISKLQAALDSDDLDTHSASLIIAADQMLEPGALVKGEVTGMVLAIWGGADANVTATGEINPTLAYGALFQAALDIRDQAQAIKQAERVRSYTGQLQKDLTNPNEH